MDVTKLLLPVRADRLRGRPRRAQGGQPGFGIEGVHLFPLGGIKTNADWAIATAAPRRARRASMKERL